MLHVRSTCTRECGGGTQDRQVICQNVAVNPPQNMLDQYCTKTKDTTTQACWAGSPLAPVLCAQILAFAVLARAAVQHASVPELPVANGHLERLHQALVRFRCSPGARPAVTCPHLFLSAVCTQQRRHHDARRLLLRHEQSGPTDTVSELIHPLITTLLEDLAFIFVVYVLCSALWLRPLSHSPL